MKRILFVGALLSMLLLLCFPAAALAEETAFGATEPQRSERGDDGAVTKYYTFASSAPGVHTEQLFFDGMNAEDSNTPVHFDLQAENFSLRFSYDLLYRNIGKYADFTMQCTLRELREDTGLSRRLCEKLGERALYLDFPDGEHYPGIATLSVPLARFVGQRVSLWRIVQNESGEKSLAPVVDSILLDEKATLRIDVTESHDYLVVESAAAHDAAALLSAAVRPIVLSEKALPRFAVILILIGAVLLLGGSAVLLVLRFRKKRRAAALLPAAEAEKKQIPKSRRNQRKRKRGQTETTKPREKN